MEEFPKRENITDVLKKYKEKKESGKLPSSQEILEQQEVVKNEAIPKRSIHNPEEFEKTMSKETDPDLMTSYEIVKLPSNGLLYPDKLSVIEIEYMTSRDEDLLTTPSLIDNGTVIDTLLKRKIKTKGVKPENLLSGDRSALILFLRTSSYGTDYKVNVTDPRTGNQFKANVDLSKLKYKEMSELPDENGHFNVYIPMRKKAVKFRLLTVGDDDKIYKQAEALQEAYNEEVSQYSTLKLKSHIVSIDGKTDRSYIDRFVDAMPALDALTIRRKIIEVSPEIDMSYEFTAKDGYKFKANLTLGIDFFFPNI
ncbi:MAG: hypothetical protein ACOC2U_01170 [bacterium]